MPALAWPAHPGQEAVLGEQCPDVVRALGDARGRDADVLDHQRGARRARDAHDAVHPFAHAPEDLGLVPVAREGRRLEQRCVRQCRERRLLRGIEGGCIVRAQLDEQRGAVRGQLTPALGHARKRPARRDQRDVHHQLDRRRPSLDKRGHGLRRLVDGREEDQRGRGVVTVRDGVEHGLGHEAQRAFAPDQQPREDLDRLVRVEERAQPVAGRVLDRELAPDPCGELLVGADLVADRRETLGKLGLFGCKPLRGVRRRRVDHGSRGEHERERAQRRIGICDHSAAHPAAVVRNDAADRRDVGRRRIGPDAPLVLRERPVDVAEQRSRLHAHTRSAVLDLQPAPVTPNVDEDPVGLCLAVQRSPARAEGHGNAGPPPVCEHLRDVVHVVRDDDDLGDQPVRARI